ncbi:TPA: helix-turn-helix domain-containing protein [Clostridioides difficile]
MFKEINLEDAKYLLELFYNYGSFRYLEEDDLKKYSIRYVDKAYTEYINGNDDDFNIFINAYNDYLSFRKENKEEFLVILRKAQNLSDACSISDYFASRNNCSRLEGDWLSIKEIQDYLDKEYYVYIVKNKYFRIEHEIDKIEELIQYRVFTFEEVENKLGMDENTLRDVIKQNNLIKGINYSKIGDKWFITEEALLKLVKE